MDAPRRRRWCVAQIRQTDSQFVGKRMRERQQPGNIPGKQFVIGIPAREMGDWDSDERILIQEVIDALLRTVSWFWWIIRQIMENSILIRRYRAQVERYTRALERITGKVRALPVFVPVGAIEV